MTKQLSNIALSALILSFLLVFFSCGSAEEKDGTGEETAKTELSTTHESIYQVSMEWHSHLGDTLDLSSLKGKTPILAMVFTNCGYACPRMVADLKMIQEKIPEDQMEDVVLVLVSFDTERDTPERLNKYADEMQLQGDWLLLHGDEEDVRTLSMLLDVHYKKQESGDFAHSNKIVLLNREGEVVAEVNGLGSDPSPILNKLKELS